MLGTKAKTSGRWTTGFVSGSDLVNDVLSFVVTKGCKNDALEVKTIYEGQEARTCIVVPNIGQMISARVVGFAD